MSKAVGAGCAQSAHFARRAAEMRWCGVPGASLATVNRNEIEASQFGLRDVAARLPVTAGSIFEAASLSKPVFAYAVFSLVRAGGLDLDRSLDSYLPSQYPISDSRAKTITARHILTHTSGLPNWRQGDIAPLKLSFAPGTRYQYSGEGFYFLQTVVEAITGKSTEHFMRTTLDELGMHDSSYIWRESNRTNYARPHGGDAPPNSLDTAQLGRQLTQAGRGAGKPLEAWQTADALAALPRLHPAQVSAPHNAMPNAAWSLLTTANDYARFVRALLQQPQHPMFHPVVRITDYIWRGLGISLQKDGDALAFFHTGANPGFKAVMFGDFATKLGVVSFTNSEGGFPFNMHVVEDAVGPQ
ncbi:MAG: beta-lactamase family protein, partial [Candidatus Eremiobacteraeota bacterium]|nr:beta-lactamase family protein [Candidatus Eremiobacteraeota bacterium]